MSPVNRSAPIGTLRDYQRDTVDAVHGALAGQRRPTGTGVQTSPAIVLATGLGKTRVSAELIAAAHAQRKRALFLVNRDELVRQSQAHLHSVMPGASIGVVKGAQDDWRDCDIVIGSVQTLGRDNRRERIPSDYFGFGVADEIQFSTAATWLNTMHGFGKLRGMPWVGMTATFQAPGKKHLGDIWPEVVIQRDTAWGIAHGWLVKPEGVRVQIADLDLAEVKRSRDGDLMGSDLGDALHNADAGRQIAEAYRKECPERRGLIFAPTKATAFEFAECMRAEGFTCETVVADTPITERQAIYERFRTGETLVISNCAVLTTGFDAPWAEVCVIARPTESEVLYRQMIGRVLRPFPAGGKTSALVMDVVGASERHALASLAKVTHADPDREDDEKHERTPSDLLDPEQVPDERMFAEGKLVTTAVDLMASSSSAWGFTLRKSIPFLPTMGAYYFLWPDGESTFTLGRQPSKGGKAVKLEDGLTLEYGMAWGERYAEDEDTASGIGISAKGASWRKGNYAPSDKQIAYATTLNRQAAREGLPPIQIEGTTKRQIAADISAFEATRLIDRF